MKRLICAVMVFLLVVTCFCACSSNARTEDAGVKAEMSYNQSSNDAIYGVAEQSQESLADKTTGQSALQSQKLIRSMTVEAETADMEALLSVLNEKISALGGYVENQSVRNGGSSSNRRYRYADLTIRIPADRLEAFFAHVRGQSNVIYYQESADDVTLSYVATQSRITALETEQDRLLELLAKAENMSDLLLIEQRLTEVRTELEKVTSQLRVYDNLVDYGTLNLMVTEVQDFTVVEEETVWQRISSGFAENLSNLGTFLVDMFVAVVVSLPYWTPIAAAVILVVIAVKRRKRASNKTKEDPQQEA